MKNNIKNLVLSTAAIMSTSVFAVDPDWNTNPFLEEETKQSKGVQIYSFSEKPNEFTKSAQDQDYVKLANETNTLGYSLVHSTQIRNFDKLVAEYKDADKEFQRSLKSEIMRINSFSSKSQSGIEQDISMQSTVNTARLDSVLNRKFVTIHKSIGGNFVPGKGWDQLSKIVKSPTLGTVIIDIVNLESGITLYMDADAINYYVNDNQGILYVLQDENGQAETTLTWADEKNSYTIQLDRNVNIPSIKTEFEQLITSISENLVRMEALDR
ncbi:hypothetical protein [Pseudoalteromonas rhizosphaerae]|uniref:Uncharacterized protein n=1 Tax=Pseudoalteromonas rhizosphaerae TaxID=2518973 RepID=A0ABW8L6Q2_9GAMM